MSDPDNRDSKNEQSVFDRARAWARTYNKQRQPFNEAELRRRFEREDNLINERFGGVTNANHQR